MREEKLLKSHGDLGNFAIRVQHRQNGSWQGRVTWLEENKTLSFRSVLELLKVMESALDTVDMQACKDWFADEDENEDEEQTAELD